MGYRIEYEGYDPGKNNRPVLGTGVMTSGFFLLFLLLTAVFWPEGRAFLRELLLPGEAIEAAEAFAARLEEGITWDQAARDFCRQVLSCG